MGSVYCESPRFLHTAYTEAPRSVVRSSAPARPFYVPTGRSAVRVLHEEMQPQRRLLASVVTVAPGGFEVPFLSELLVQVKPIAAVVQNTCLVRVGDPLPPAQLTWQWLRSTGQTSSRTVEPAMNVEISDAPWPWTAPHGAHGSHAPACGWLRAPDNCTWRRIPPLTLIDFGPGPHLEFVNCRALLYERTG
jgi:hypothetical protein